MIDAGIVAGDTGDDVGDDAAVSDAGDSGFVDAESTSVMTPAWVRRVTHFWVDAGCTLATPAVTPLIDTGRVIAGDTGDDVGDDAGIVNAGDSGDDVGDDACLLMMVTLVMTAVMTPAGV